MVLNALSAYRQRPSDQRETLDSERESARSKASEENGLGQARPDDGDGEPGRWTEAG